MSYKSISTAKLSFPVSLFHLAPSWHFRSTGRKRGWFRGAMGVDFLPTKILQLYHTQPLANFPSADNEFFARHHPFHLLPHYVLRCTFYVLRFIPPHHSNFVIPSNSPTLHNTRPF